MNAQGEGQHGKSGNLWSVYGAPAGTGGAGKAPGNKGVQVFVGGQGGVVHGPAYNFARSGSSDPGVKLRESIDHAIVLINSGRVRVQDVEYALTRLTRFLESKGLV